MIIYANDMRFSNIWPYLSFFSIFFWAVVESMLSTVNKANNNIFTHFLTVE